MKKELKKINFNEKKIISALVDKKPQIYPPIWIMRQAGRYLPEYREIRKNSGSFLDLCYNPKLASEVTLQPISRFDFDAAIIFSDILTIPDALGLKVEFIEKIGPKINPIDQDFNLEKLKLNQVKSHLSPVFEAINITKSKIPSDKALIGFSGSPFTLACYMIEGGGSKNFEKVKKIICSNPDFFEKLIDIITDAVVIYLKQQIIAGADIVKLFDSWAGILPFNDYQNFVIKPNTKIVNKIKEAFLDTPVICFAKGSGSMILDFAKDVKCDCLAIDQNFNNNWVIENIQKPFKTTIQGNFDNYLLAFGNKENIVKSAKQIVKDFNQNSFIFNLGHGILPETPIKNVELLIKTIREKN